MMKVKRNILRILLSVMLISFMTAGSASATLVLLDDFTLKVGSKYIDDIDKMVYTGVSHVDISDDDASGWISVNDKFTDALVFNISATGLNNDSTGTILKYRDGSDIVGTDFELTGVVTLTGHHTSLVGLNAGYVFDTATYDFYLDTSPDAAPGMGGGIVSGYKNEPLGATHIATYDLLSGGGNFDFNLMDGNIDVTFLSSMTASGYMFDEWGNDFATYGSLLAALTDSNSDESLLAMANNWTAYTGQAIGTDPWDLNLDVDGSQRYGVVPEPATMLLLGSGLIGLAGFGRKKKFFKKD